MGIITEKSNYTVGETVSKLQAVLRSKGIKIFDIIDQQEEASKVGLTMSPTTLLLFGDPKTGTPLMNITPPLAIDLPLKAVVWEDSKGVVWVSYNSPEYFKERHHLNELPFKAIPNLINSAIH